jgi:hypothetical protein
VPVIARLVAADEDTVRAVIHRFNELGMGALDPRWAGGRPRRISAEDETFLVATATTRPGRLGQPFTHWSVRKLVGYLADNPHRIVQIGRERAPSTAGRSRDHLPADHDLEGSRRIRSGRPSWPASRRFSSSIRTGRSPSTSSAR